jgi:enoyl-CoA hydratase
VPTADSVVVSRHGGTALLCLNEPDRRNALSARMVDAIGEAFDDLESDPSVRCVVLTGNGPAFCAGARLETLRAAAAGDFDSVKAVYNGFLRIYRSPIVTIAAVNGPAVGAGFNVALACDIRLAGRAATFDTRFSKLQIHPGGGHTWLLARAVGQQQATLACLFGQAWDAQAAVDVGLAAGVYETDDLRDTAIALGRRLDVHDREFVRRLTENLRASLTTVRHHDALVQETTAQQWSTSRPEFLDALRQIEEGIAGRSRRGKDN